MLDLLKSLVGSVAPTIASALGGPLAGAAVSFLADKLLGDKTASADDLVKLLQANTDAQLKLKELDAQFQLAELNAYVEEDKEQLEINKIQAGSGSLVDKWESYLGLVCVAAVAENYLVIPNLSIFNVHVPPLDLSQLVPLLVLLLGHGGLAAYKAVKGVK